MMKTQIGIGVLSIPSSFDTLGMAPGVICLMVIAIITTWANYIVGVFKIRHPEVYGIDDVGFKLFGRWGREIFAAIFILYWVFVAGSGILGLSISFNAMSAHGTCTAVFVVVSAIIGFLCGSIQTLGRISWLAWVGIVSILAGVFTVTIAVGVEDRPAAAPKTPGPFISDWKVTKNPSFGDAMSAIATIIFAYSGAPGYFSIVAEMKNPRKHYVPSLMICQFVMTAVYLTVGVVVYYYCGSYIASPALGSASFLLKRVSYGLAFPGLVVSTTLFVHVCNPSNPTAIFISLTLHQLPAKYIFVRALRGTRHLSSNTLQHWLFWFGCTAVLTLISYIIASAIPVFSSLVSLIGALFGKWL